MAKRVARTRASNTLTEAEFFGKLRSGLRYTFRYWKPAMDAKRDARRKSQRSGLKWEYACAECSGWFPEKEIDVDHIFPCGALKSYEDIGGFVERLTCEKDGFAVLCKACHKEKTNRERTLKSDQDPDLFS